jgi:hypothetical protein
MEDREASGEQATGGGASASERGDLNLWLEKSEALLANEARIFLPLLAIALIVAMPIWTVSLNRFLKLLVSPFVLLPLGFCIMHLAIAWRRIIKTRRRIRQIELGEDSRRSDR